MWRSVVNYAHHVASPSPRGFHPLLAVHYLTYACQFRCPYCSDGKGVPYHALSSPILRAPDTLKLLERVRRRCDWVVLTGGEPLNHPDVDRVLTELPRIGFDGVVFTTIGAALDEHLDSVAAGVSDLVVSLDTLDSEKGDRWLGRPGTHRRILENVELAARRPRRRYRVIISSVATPDNLPDIGDVHRFAREYGFRHAVSAQLVGVHPNPALRGNPEYRALFDQVIAAKRQGHDVEGSIPYLEHMRDFIQFRCVPSTVLALSPTGDVYYPCLELGNVAGNLLAEPDLDVIRASGRARHGPEPRCGNRCQSPCALSFALIVARPAIVLDEMWRIFARSVRRLLGRALPFRSPRRAPRPGSSGSSP